MAGIEEEDRATEGLTWKEYWLPGNRLRMFIVVTMQIGMLPCNDLSRSVLT